MDGKGEGQGMQLSGEGKRDKEVEGSGGEREREDGGMMNEIKGESKKREGGWMEWGGREGG